MKILKNWYLEKYERDGKEWVIAHGNVFHHEKLPNGMLAHTSYVKEVKVEDDTAIVITKNSEYVCHLDSARFESFDEEGRKMVPDFDGLRKKYEQKLEIPESDDGVLICLNQDAEDFFAGAALRINGEVHEKRAAMVHLGMVQDSVLICWDGVGQEADFRYFPNDILEFYRWTDSLDVYIKNVGDRLIKISVYGNEYEILPQRMLLAKQGVFKEEKGRGQKKDLIIGEEMD